MKLPIRVQILDEIVCVSLHTNVLEKGMDLSVLLTFIYGQLVEQTRFFSLRKIISPGRLYIQNQLCSAWKMILSRILIVVEVSGKYILWPSLFDTLAEVPLQS